MRRPVVLAAAVALSLGATGCSSGGSTRDPAAFCAQLKKELPLLNASATTGTKQERQAVADAYARMQDIAPGDIELDWKAIAGLFDKLAQLDMSKDDSYGTAYVLAVQEDVRTAAPHITSYVKTTCGIDLNGAGSTATDGTTTATTAASGATATTSPAEDATTAG